MRNIFKRKTKEEKIEILEEARDKQLNKIIERENRLTQVAPGTKTHTLLIKAISEANDKFVEIVQKLNKLGVAPVQAEATIGHYDTLPSGQASENYGTLPLSPATPPLQDLLVPNLNGPKLVAANLGVENPIDWYNATKGNYGELPNVDDDQFESLFPSVPDNLDTLSRAKAAPTPPARPTPPPSVQDSVAQRADMDSERLQTHRAAQHTATNKTLDRQIAATPAAPAGREERGVVAKERSARADQSKENSLVDELTATLARRNVKL